MGYIKNIPHESILRLAEQVSIQPGQVVSKTRHRIKLLV